MRRGACRVLVGILKEIDQLEDVSVDRKIISMFNFMKLDGKA